MFNEKASNYLKPKKWAEKHIKRKMTKKSTLWSTMAPGQDTFKTNACILMLTLVRNHPNTFLQSHWALPHQENPVLMLPLQVGLHSHISHDFSWTFLPGLGGQQSTQRLETATWIIQIIHTDEAVQIQVQSHTLNVSTSFPGCDCEPLGKLKGNSWAYWRIECWTLWSTVFYQM